MNYEYEVILSNGHRFYAESKHTLETMNVRILSGSPLEFHNAIVHSDHVAAVIVWTGEFGGAT